MLDLPEYFDSMYIGLGETLTNVYAGLENVFNKLNYDDHHAVIEEDLNTLGMRDDTESLNNIKKEYKDSTIALIGKLGVTLIDPDNQPIHKLGEVLVTLQLIGSMPLTELLDGEVVSEDLDGLEYLVTVMAKILETNPMELMLVIGDVTSEVVDIIKRGGTVEEWVDQVSVRYRDRFISAIAGDKTGIACDYVRSQVNFGYDAANAIDQVSESLQELKDTCVIAKELNLLIAGSDADPSEGDLIFSDATERLWEPRVALSINAKMGSWEWTS